MLGDKRIVIVIPAYRAADTIAPVIKGMPGFVDAIIVVDDGSPDDTAGTVTRCRDPRVKLLRREMNGGVGSAMVDGLECALHVPGDIVVKMDADGQMDAGALPGLLAPLIDQGFDYAKGNRFYDLASLQRMPFARRVGNMALSLLTKAASGYWNVYDPQNGYLAIRREALERLDLSALDPGYFFENSMLVQLNIINARVAEVPMPARYGDERTSMNLALVLFAFPWKLVRAGVTRVRLKYFGMDISPIAVLLAVGVPLVFGGGAYGAYEWIRHALIGQPTPAGSVMLAALPILLGTQMLLNALLMDISQTPPGLGIRTIAGRGSKRARPGASRG